MTNSHEEEDQAVGLHKKFVVIDAHSDIPLDIVLRRKRGEKKVFERLHVPKFVAGGVNASCVTVWCDAGNVALGSKDQPHTIAMRVIDSMKHEFHESPDFIVHAKSTKEIKQSARNGKIALLLHLEGGMPLWNDLMYLRFFYEQGVRSVGLTWSNRNLIADGLGERSNSGLSNFGVELLEEMNRVGVIVDVSHLSTKAFFEVLQFSKDPVVASHSNARSVCDHPRNLTDEQIKALAEKGGVMGMNFYPEFISKEKPGLEKLLDHVDYVTNLVGVDHIGVGADFVDFLGPWYLMETLPPYPAKIENVSKMHNFTRGLLSRGYSDKEIEKILGGNLLRVYEKILG